jgi:hypothetical protein
MSDNLDKIDLNSIDWDAEIAKKPREIPKPKKWEAEDIKDIFGFPLSIGDKILRATEPKYPDTEVFVKAVIKKIDLTRDHPLGVLSEGKERLGWIGHNRVLSQPSLTKIL